MDRDVNVTLIVASILLFFAILAPFTVPGFYGADDDFEGFLAGICFFVVFFIVGITTLVAGLARSGRAHQQQQQQVVVLGAGGMPVAGTTAATRLKCPTCQHLNPEAARFCTQCATYIGRKAA